jgi:hypothetical protein
MAKRKPTKVDDSEFHSLPTMDFGSDEENPSRIPEFDQAMRGIMSVPKSDIDTQLRREKKKRNRKKNA